MSDSNSGVSAKPTGKTGVQEATRADPKQKPKQLPPYHVVLLNDDDHTYEYVIQLLQKVFAYPAVRGLELARQVDKSNRAIVFTTHKELAELKREQIESFGADHRIASCKGSMTAVIEPA